MHTASLYNFINIFQPHDEIKHSELLYKKRSYIEWRIALSGLSIKIGAININLYPFMTTVVAETLVILFICYFITGL